MAKELEFALYNMVDIIRFVSTWFDLQKCVCVLLAALVRTKYTIA